MKPRLYAAITTFALACHGAMPPVRRPPPPTLADATAAYEAHDWATCSRQWAAIADATENRARALYNAASCDALAGHADQAFARLEVAIEQGYRNVEHLGADGDLQSLHADPRWAHVVAAARAREDAWERSLGDPALRRELLAMAAEDQAARDAWLGTDQARGSPAWNELEQKVEAVDRKNTARLAAVVESRGWPGDRLVGEDGASAAWLLAQHADLAPELQQRFLAQMKLAVDRGDASAGDYAYLYDRVAVAAHRKQLYGTQFNGSEPLPIEDEAHVDARRAAVGLPSMAEYRKKMLEVYGAPR